MRLGRLWVGVGDGAKKILSLAVNISIPIAQASFRICIVYSLAYSYLYGYAMNRRSTPVGAEVKILSLVVNKSKLRLQQASFLNLSFVYSLAYPYLYDYVKKILSLAVNISIPIAQASFRICIVYSLAYSYLCKRLYS